MAIPEIQKAAVKTGKGPESKVEVKEIPVPKIGPGQILVKVNYSGLCGTDKSFYRDEWAAWGGVMRESAFGVAGHEGAGVVVAVADDVKGLWNVGDRAGVKFLASICRNCEFCQSGDEIFCVKGKKSSLTEPGTFQEYVATDAYYASRIPDGVKDEEAGPVMCGGLTAYMACRRSNVRPGQWLVLPGAGGGLGHFGVQYAKALGMRVIAIDGGDAKKELCLKLGAEHFIDFTTTHDIPTEIKKITTYGAHGVVVTAASKAGYETAPNFLRQGGTMVCVGIPNDLTIRSAPPPLVVVTRKLNIVGTYVGNNSDVQEALDFVARGLVKPLLTVGEFKDLDRFMDDMETGKMIGRAVIKIGA
ncbi:GroES-like protein [Rhizodiscina lignyota]|uniref:GroES-like protein n=1 Tax=Rhizodiscina lignyota TaxID=1504668 RepID=A0A9P4I633_9PEZI|nr:GroES-like protein [Rhizodiscina lignyota]